MHMLVYLCVYMKYTFLYILMCVCLVCLLVYATLLLHVCA